ncbi:MAG: NAD-dependent epimerase/dehydratase family protein, partial [Planctomycetota bacterium]|nr:NAD-dependent epimerase/dehydratase family protein [Planctomycetota bacterium]
MAHKQALVTGGAGFIGSHLCEHLLADGWSVAAVDDLSTGAIANIKHLEANPAFRLFVGSAAEEDLLREAGRDAQVVFHLAAVVGVKKVIDDPVAAIEKNLRATEAVLRFCNRFRRRLLITSTSEVYGDSPKELFSEDDASVIGNSRHRRWSYAAAKLLDEFHAFAYFYSSALPVTIARLFNTIGPRQVGHYGMVVPTFISQALRQEPITVFGDGEQRRCFTGVRDAVRCLMALAQKPETAGQIYNVGSQEEVSIRQLAEMIKRMTASTSPIVFRSYREAYGEEFSLFPPAKFHDGERFSLGCHNWLPYFW